MFTLLAIAWANAHFRDTYEALWHREVSLAVGGTELVSLEHVVSDGLRALFFSPSAWRSSASSPSGRARWCL